MILKTDIQPHEAKRPILFPLMIDRPLSSAHPRSGAYSLPVFLSTTRNTFQELHLQAAINAQQANLSAGGGGQVLLSPKPSTSATPDSAHVIPTPSVTAIHQTDYENLYPPTFKPTKQLLKVQGLFNGFQEQCWFSVFRKTTAQKMVVKLLCRGKPFSELLVWSWMIKPILKIQCEGYPDVFHWSIFCF